MTDRKQDTHDPGQLDELFAAVRQDVRATPDAALMARVLGDAVAMQPPPAAVAPHRAAAGVPGAGGRWAQFVSAIGGWPSLAGLGAATAASVLAGFFASSALLPDSLSTLLSLNDDSYLLYLDQAELFEPEEI
ncbi:hypothetical protein [Shimia sp.]|uniref:hypothetical protein n=1 Tax=Shimia sp. TaxID=1954381 RepID=UPI0035684B32